MDGSNNLRAGGIHRHDNVCVCDRCHTELYGPAKVGKVYQKKLLPNVVTIKIDYQEYGPAPGKESLEERRLRMAKAKEEYQQGLSEFSASNREEVRIIVAEVNL